MPLDQSTGEDRLPVYVTARQIEDWSRLAQAEATLARSGSWVK